MALPRFKTILSLALSALLLTSCGNKASLCELSEADAALKEALALRMTRWQENADFAGMNNFQEEVGRVIDALVVSKNEFYRGNDESCTCSAKIQFGDHNEFMETIAAPVAKVTAKEHPINSAYLKMEEQISYLENEGLEFFYVLNKKSDGSLEAQQNYGLILQPQVSDAGKILWDYMEYRNQ